MNTNIGVNVDPSEVKEAVTLWDNKPEVTSSKPCRS